MDVNFSYRKSLLAFRSRTNEEHKFQALLEGIAAEVDLFSAETCVSVGTGAGLFDLAFIARCLPHLKSIITVDRDGSNIEELRENLASVLPNVVSSVHQKSVLMWRGPGDRVDVVLMLHVVVYLSAAERTELFRRCFDNWLKNPDGCVIVLVMNRDKDIPFRQVLRRMLPNYDVPDGDEIKAELTAAGYRITHESEYQFDQDYSNPDEHLLRFFNYVGGCSVDLDKIRDIITDVVPDGRGLAFAKLMVVKNKSPLEPL